MQHFLGTDCAVGVSPNCFQSYTEDVHVQRVQVSQTEERFTHRQVAEGTVTLSSSQCDNRYGPCKYVPARPNLSTGHLSHLSTGPPDLAAAWSMITWLLDRVAAVESTVNIALSTAVAAHEACENLVKLADEKEENMRVQEGGVLLGGEAAGALRLPVVAASEMPREFTPPPIARGSTAWSESGLSESDGELLALKSRLMQIRESLSQPNSPAQGALTNPRRLTKRSIDTEYQIPDDAAEDPDTPGIGSHRRVPFDIPSPLPVASIEDGPTPCPFRTLYGERTSRWAHCLQQAFGDVDAPCDPIEDNEIATEEISPKPNNTRERRAASAASTVCPEQSRRCCSMDARSDDSGVLL